MRYIFEFSGEHRVLPLAELNGILEAEHPGTKATLDSPGIGIVESGKNLKNIFKRSALCRSISDLRFICPDPSYDEIKKTIIINQKDLEGTFAIDARRILGHHRGLSTSKLEQILGRALISQASNKLKVNLDNPDMILKMLLSRKCYIGKLLWDSNRKELELRHGRNRPFFSPISLHPKFARVMVNLARVRPGMTMLDPFCGTGGILLEGAAIGLTISGSDISKKMVDGASHNLDFFKFEYKKLQHCDIEECADKFGKMDAVVTDPPYGRSASTSGEELIDLYDRTFKTIKSILKRRHYLVMMLPDEAHMKLGENYFKLHEHYSVYVHRSLTRHICVYQN